VTIFIFIFIFLSLFYNKMLKINNIEKISPYFFVPEDVINLITIENVSTETVYVTLENITLDELNKIQFMGSNIVLDIKNCTFVNLTTTEDVTNLFINYTASNITIVNLENILQNNKRLCKCFMPSAENSVANAQIGIDTSTIDILSTSFDLTKTFTLHSKLGSNRFIYLNFLGCTLSDSLWNNESNKNNPITVPKFDTLINEDTTKKYIQLIWRSVADAFSIWDVDVTTEPPTAFDNGKIINTPDKYGIQCLIGGNSDTVLGGGSYGGVAYLYSFPKTILYKEPCFVFPENLSRYHKFIATVTVHEIGHTLGLIHSGTKDGTTIVEYYRGNGIWAPFMGTGYNTSVNQWTKGEYANANNIIKTTINGVTTTQNTSDTQDQITIITTYLNLITDDCSNFFTNATLIKNTDTIGGIINSQTDVDMFKLNLQGSQTITIHATVTSLLPTLKVGMSLYNDSQPQTLLITNTVNPAIIENGFMDASITYNVITAGIYYLKIAGVGGDGIDNSGDPITSFNDYGSIGRYKITGTWTDVVTTPITIDGISFTVVNKIYDGNSYAIINSISFNGNYDETINTIIRDYQIEVTATFNDKNVGDNKPVTITNIRLIGPESSNYIITPPTGPVTGSITRKPLTIAGITAINRPYNGTTAVSLITSNSRLVGVFAGDTVSFLSKPTTGTFASKNVGAAIPVAISGFTLTGSNASNYIITQPTGVTANITAAPLTIAGITAISRPYNGNLTAVLDTASVNLVGKFGTDNVTILNKPTTGTFNNKNVGTAKPVTISGFTLTGSDASNYTLTQPTGVRANIYSKPLNITGTTAYNKPYDRNTTARVNVNNSRLSTTDKIASDNVILNKNNVRGTFINSAIGNNKRVFISGFTITGADAPNYTLIQPTNVYANITARSRALLINTIPADIIGRSRVLLINTIPPNITARSRTLLKNTIPAHIIASRFKSVIYTAK